MALRLTSRDCEAERGSSSFRRISDNKPWSPANDTHSYSQGLNAIASPLFNAIFQFTWVRLKATRANTAWDTLALFSSFLTC